MAWRWDGPQLRWQHDIGTIITQGFIETLERDTVQRIASEATGEGLPEEAWPPPVVDPAMALRVFMAAREVRKKLARVKDVRELY